jgi:hypothetical protein
MSSSLKEASMKCIVERVHASEDISRIIDVIDRDGAVIISGLISDKDVLDLREELGGLFQGAPFCQGLFYGNKTKRLHSLVAKSKMCRKLIMHSHVVAIMNRIFEGMCDKIQLNLTQGIQIGPGEKAQVLHRDDSMFPFKTKPFEFMANAMWAYSEFTKENGATMVVPGSHKWEDKNRLPKDDEITQAEMDAGEVLIYLGSLIHAGGANKSSKPRTGIAISYCLGWLRQSENQYFAAPPALAKYFPKELQDMLGYCVQRPNLGMYEGNEPNILFEGQIPAGLVTHDWLTPEQNEMLRRYYAGEELLAA